MSNIIQKTKQFSFYGSFSLMVLSLVVIFTLGLPLGIAFTGGSEIEISFSAPPQREHIEERFSSIGDSLEVVSRSFSVYTLYIQGGEHDSLQEEVRDALVSLDSEATILRFDTVGPQISGETGVRTLFALFFGFTAVVFFIAFAFSSVSNVLASWKYAVVSLITLIHDVLVSLGIFVFIAHVYTISVDVFFVTAVLAVVGYSINDTIVIFDRIRSFVAKGDRSFETAVWDGASASIRRSFYTSLSTLIPLFVIFYTIPFVQWFAFALFIGITIGTYSSLFFAPALLVWWYRSFPQDPSSAEQEENETEKAERELMERFAKG